MGKDRKFFYNIEMHGIICLKWLSNNYSSRLKFWEKMKIILQSWFEAMEFVTSK